ncbi:MAG: HAMP domain-containing sensor histidine kinase [bacterium]
MTFNDNEKIKENIIKYFPHELRTPLMPILNYSSYLFKEAEILGVDEIKDIAKTIERSGLRLLNRIEKFLILIELESIDVFSDLFQCDALFDSEFVTKLISNVLIGCDNHNQFNIQIQSTILKIHAHFLSVLLSEIIENACKFSIKDTIIKINGCYIFNKYKISITNIGCGMSSDEIDSLQTFIQFNREENNQGGNGVGLGIANKIIKLFNCEIELISEKNNFFTVVIYFPLQQNDALNNGLAINSGC